MATRKQEKGDIRDQLKSLGFEESPVSQVERLYDEHQQMTAALVAQKTPADRGRVRERMNRVRFKIDQLCDTRKVGNPFKGEPIESLKRANNRRTNKKERVAA